MTRHADLETLLAYQLGELAPEREAALEEHYLGCEACAALLGEVQALAGGTRNAFAAGQVAAVLSPAFIERLRARGVRVREYSVPRHSSVNCSVGPDDQLLVSRLQAPLAGIARLDAIVTDDGVYRLQDVPFDPATGEVLLAPGIVQVRNRPAHRQVVRLVAVEGDGDRLLGEYTFNHSPQA